MTLDIIEGISGCSGGVYRYGNPWFVLADVCRVLEIGNPSQAVSRLDNDERDTLTNNEGIIGCGANVDARAQSITIVNESGLYSLVPTSRKPAASGENTGVLGSSHL